MTSHTVLVPTLPSGTSGLVTTVGSSPRKLPHQKAALTVQCFKQKKKSGGLVRAQEHNSWDSGTTLVPMKRMTMHTRQRVPYVAATNPSVTAAAETDTKGLVDTLLEKIANTDRGAAMSEEQKAEAARLIAQLEEVGTKDPLTNPLIFGDWEVAYSSNPTSSGGSFRSSLGRTVLKTRDMVQAVKEPNIVGNQVAFNALGVIPGEVTLEGTLTTADNIWADVSFRRPTFKLGPVSFSFGGDSSVRLATTYLDERIRIGKGSRGSSFVFKRK